MSLLWEVTNQFGGYLYPTFWSGYGGIYNPAGLGAQAVYKHKAQMGSVINFPGSEPIANVDLLELDVDIPVMEGGIGSGYSRDRGWDSACKCTSSPGFSQRRSVKILVHTVEAGIIDCVEIGDLHSPVLGAPVAAGMTGISVSAGLNVISAIQEVGIAVAVEPVAAVMDYSEFETL